MSRSSNNNLSVAIFTILLLMAIVVNGQTTRGIPYQAVLRDSLGQPLRLKDILVRISLMDSVETGSVLYEEQHELKTSALGIFNLILGKGAFIFGDFEAIDWAENSKFLKVEVDTTATGSSFNDLGSQQLNYVPYALYAANGIPKGYKKGELLYWDQGWKKLSPGQKGQNLRIGENGLPEWFGKSYTLGIVETTEPNGIDIGATNSKLGGKLIFNGNADDFTVGICWSTQANPTYVAGTKIEVKNPIDTVFNWALNNLTPATTYFARSFVITPMGLSYGNEISFTTKDIDIVSGLITYFPFDGSVNDFSGNGYNGTATGIGFGVDRNGVENGAGVFSSAQSSHLFIPASAQLEPTSYTISAWVKTNVIQYGGLEQGKLQYIIGYLPFNWSKGPAFSMTLNETDNSILKSIQWTSSTSWQGVTTPSGFIKIDQWYLLTTTFDSATGIQSLYVNGTLYAQANSILQYNGHKGFYIGATTENSTGRLYGFFQGKIDEVRFYSRALTSEEVGFLYNH